jgi:hypothetical protein
MGMNRSHRFALFLAELEKAPAAHDQASARALLGDIMNRIEEAHSGVPYDPEKWMTDGRMYPPHDDFEQPCPLAGAVLFHSLGHAILFASNGAIRIEGRRRPNKGRIALDKPGADEKLCPRNE